MSWRVSKSAIFLAVMAIQGCGMSVKYGLSGINIPTDVKTFSVELFENNAALVNPLLAQVITEKLKDKYIRQTGLRIVSDNADWSFKGNIVQYNIEPLNRQTISGGTRNKLTIIISVKFANLKNETEDFEKQYTKFQDFDSNADFAGLESGLIDELTTLLIQDIFTDTALKW